MADDKKNIPDAGKVDEPPKPGKVEPVKVSSPVQDQPASAKAEAPVIEDASKVVTPPATEKPVDGKTVPDPATEQAATAGKVAKDRETPAPSKMSFPGPVSCTSFGTLLPQTSEPCRNSPQFEGSFGPIRRNYAGNQGKAQGRQAEGQTQEHRPAEAGGPVDEREVY